MANALQQLAAGRTVGHFGLGLRGTGVGTGPQQVHDGDTINVRALGNFGVRFLGVDAPEISFTLPGETAFTGLSNPKWETFLSDPFAGTLPAFSPPLDLGLLNHLQGRVGPGTAGNHSQHATVAEDALEAEVQNDIAVLGQTKDTFEFYLEFAHEVMDGYGRLLAYINRNQPNPNQPAPRPLRYNDRLLQQGRVSPYFIWPNIDPFVNESSLTAAVPDPGTAATLEDSAPALKRARQSIQAARLAGIGIFAALNPLALQPFEIRFLARRQPPARWVIDLSKNDSTLIHPQKYFTVANIEDRLFIPEEFVPLFVEAGWQRGP
jgi:endonuclease YncB( thermonuclease family)